MVGTKVQTSRLTEHNKSTKVVIHTFNWDGCGIAEQ